MNPFRLFRRSALLSRKDAERVARSYVESQNWLWEEPVSIRRRFSTYEFWTSTDRIGGNVIVEVDVRTGQVTKGRVLPR